MMSKDKDIDLTVVVETLISGRPHTLTELTDATGASAHAVCRVILRMQREGIAVIDAAPRGPRALWFILDGASVEARRAERRVHRALAKIG